MGQAFGQQQQPFGGMGGVPPAAMGQQQPQPTVNPTNPFNAGVAGFPQMPQQQPQSTGPSFDLSDEFLGLGAKKQEEPQQQQQQTEKPAADPFRVATPVSSAGEPAAVSAGDDAGFGQGSGQFQID